MKRMLVRFSLSIALICLAAETTAHAQPTATTNRPALKHDPRDFSPELDAITARVKENFTTGKTNAADLQASLKAINGLIAAHYRTGMPEQVARLYLLDAHIYADGLNDTNRAQAIWEQVERDFPGTLAAAGAHLSLVQLVPEGLEAGQRFPGFNAQGISTISRLGHVTLIDFWATWCGPCKEEMPNVIAVYKAFHPKGFEIIGISLDSDKTDLTFYLEAFGVGWPQYFDGLGWQNQLAVRYGVKSIPANYLLNRHGIIIGKDLRGRDLGEAVAAAMAAK